ncbi:MAG: hypothetical protein RLY31_1841 [Bacteroidota bacterium]
MTFRIFPLLLLTLFGIFLPGCRQDESLTYEEQLAVDIQKIQDYLVANNLTAQTTASGLHYIVETEGNGQFPGPGAVVTVYYKGYFLDGAVFDQTGTQPATFSLNSVISGWQEGIPKFSRGGKGKLLLPSGLAYGKNPPGSIPANAVMIFDVELVDF